MLSYKTILVIFAQDENPAGEVFPANGNYLDTACFPDMLTTPVVSLSRVREAG